MKLKTLRRIAIATALVCISFNLFGVYALLYALMHGDMPMVVVLFVYIAFASAAEYWLVMRIWTGKLLSGQWSYDD